MDITSATVRALLREQHPDLADLPLSQAGTGWDNAQWRLGEQVAVRLPVRAESAPLILHEQQWLPRLAAGLPIDTPAPVRLGTPSADFPWPWSVVPWFTGVTVGSMPIAERTDCARDLAEFMVALHRPAPTDAPANPFRGTNLDRDPSRFAARLAAVPSITPRVATNVLALRADLVTADRWSGPALWLHGDPHPANLLAHHGRLRAVIDFGDITAGDPASDLATAWLTFDAGGRRIFRETINDHCAWGDDMWQRARAWALHIAIALLSKPDQHPHLVPMGAAALAQAMRG